MIVTDGTDTVQLSGTQALNIFPLDGADTVNIEDLTGTEITTVNVNLGRAGSGLGGGLTGSGAVIIDGGCGPVIGVNNNFSEDPRFGQLAGCPPANGDYCLENDSPLLPENSPPGCGQIGAVGACLPIGVPGLDPAPSVLAIHAAKPNPFSETATIPFELPTAGEVLVTIYNARGEAVLIQPSQQRSAGPGHVVWDGRHRSGERCPPGVYFARIEVGGRAMAARLVLIY